MVGAGFVPQDSPGRRHPWSRRGAPSDPTQSSISTWAAVRAVRAERVPHPSPMLERVPRYRRGPPAVGAPSFDLSVLGLPLVPGSRAPTTDGAHSSVRVLGLLLRSSPGSFPTPLHRPGFFARRLKDEDGEKSGGLEQRSRSTGRLRRGRSARIRLGRTVGTPTRRVLLGGGVGGAIRHAIRHAYRNRVWSSTATSVPDGWPVGDEQKSRYPPAPGCAARPVRHRRRRHEGGVASSSERATGAPPPFSFNVTTGLSRGTPGEDRGWADRQRDAPRRSGRHGRTGSACRGATVPGWAHQA